MIVKPSKIQLNSQKFIHKSLNYEHFEGKTSKNIRSEQFFHEREHKSPIVLKANHQKISHMNNTYKKRLRGREKYEKQQHRHLHRGWYMYLCMCV